MSVFWYQVYQARVWERMLTSRGLPSDSTCVLKAEISKDANLVFYLSVYPLLNSLQTSDYDVFFVFVLIQRYYRRHSKSATSSWPDKGNMPWDRKRLLGCVETIQLILGVTDKVIHMMSNPKQVPNEIWLLLAQWFLNICLQSTKRYLCWKVKGQSWPFVVTKSHFSLGSIYQISIITLAYR